MLCQEHKAALGKTATGAMLDGPQESASRLVRSSHSKRLPPWRAKMLP